MKYYLHDTSAFQDEKITKLFMKYGYEGLGLFYTLLEKLALQEKPIEKSVLKKQLFVGKKLEKCLNFMEEIGIICTKNGETFNENILKFSEKYQIKKEKTRKKVYEWRNNQLDKNIVTGYKVVRNQRKVNKSKVNKSKVNNNTEIKIYYPEIHELNSWSKDYFHEKFINDSSLDIFDKLIRIDNYTIQQIKDAITWARNDQFWTDNFLSPAKLRNKNKDGVKYIDVFLAKILNKKNGNTKQNGASWDEISNMLKSKFAQNK